MKKIKVGIAGAAGYTGCELIRLLRGHPHVEIAWLMTGKTNAGKPMEAVFPHLRGVLEMDFIPLDPAAGGSVDAAFLCMPHGVSVSLVSDFLEAGCRVVDLSADYRLKDRAVYEAWYETEHTAPALLGEAVYGLTELYRRHLPGARLCANPGCYPTVSILALAPLLAEGIVAPDSLVIDAKSGVSGAGRGLSLGTHFPECDEDFMAYKVLAHRHTPEIEQELGLLAGQPLGVCFVPHLVPMVRGMLATAYARTAGAVRAEGLQALYERFYADEPFVRVLPAGALPRTKNVWGTNGCELAVRLDARGERVVAIGAIDNLVKGASGEAVQNLNVMFGLPEKAGLDLVPLYP